MNEVSPISNSHAHVKAGQTTGIIGMLLAFVCLGPIGLIFSIISAVQLTKAGASKTLSTLGIFFNLISIAVALFFAAMLAHTWRS